MKKAFTLAELMIVLCVIGVLVAVLLPAVRNAMPDKDVMKFKKGHRAFVEAVREMVNSEKYYFNGDLGMRPDKTLIDGSHSGDNTYFCEVFADIVNVKEKNCQSTILSGDILGGLQINVVDEASRIKQQSDADERCLKFQNYSALPELISTDGVFYYQAATTIPFGAPISSFQNQAYGDLTRCQDTYLGCDARLFYVPSQRNALGSNELYKVFCMDIDGFKKGEAPFGYGVRTDGKVLFGTRASEWLKKSVQGND
ncbi:MAG: prepilin-type N-terminal cleavage/methylation domain-containing protein [Candidatus Gastranaerophilales bacterium]|nr:prepilin-type N-terminal cleavage/methylation domain-containing protein [Candidatus Gastranaerophilales bacterium]